MINVYSTVFQTVLSDIISVFSPKTNSETSLISNFNFKTT